MQININYDTEYYYEGLIAVINGFNDGGPISVRQDFKNRSIDISNRPLNNMLNDSENLVHAIIKDINTEDETFKFLFKQRDYCEPYATAFLSYRRIKDSLKDDKAHAIYSILMYVVDEDSDNDKEFFEWVEDYDCDSAKKYELVKLYYKFDEYNTYVSDIVAKAEEHIKKFLLPRSQYIKEILDNIIAYLKKDDFNLIPVKLGQEEAINIYPSIVMLNALSLQKLTRFSTTNITVGIAILELIELEQIYLSRESKNMDKFLKALAEPTKYNILKLLKEKSLYNNQIANEIGLTGATISHHMNALVQLELVFIEQKGTKTYYSLNKTGFEKYVTELRKQILQ